MLHFGCPPGNPRRRHRLGRQDVRQLVFRDQPALPDDVRDGAAGLDGGLGDLGGRRVADVGAERRGDGRAAIEQLAAARLVGLDAAHAPFGEHGHGVPENRRRVQRVPGHDRHHHVQLELPGGAGGEDRGVAAPDLLADLIDHLGHRRIDLAGHDRRAGLHRRQRDLGEARAGTAAQQAEVGRHLVDFDGEPAQSARVGQHVAHALRDAEPVARRRHRDAGGARRGWRCSPA